MRRSEDVYDARIIVEKNYEWDKWAQEIPFLNIPENYKIKVIPPVNRAVVRFLVSNQEETKDVSVYLDCYEELGFFGGEPYWELYPDVDGDIYRCGIDEVEELVKRIVKSIESQ